MNAVDECSGEAPAFAFVLQIPTLLNILKGIWKQQRSEEYSSTQWVLDTDAGGLACETYA